MLRATRPDHPRVCGEKFAEKLTRIPEKGSPPRVRGKAVPSGAAVGAVGITPACAGKSQKGEKAVHNR